MEALLLVLAGIVTPLLVQLVKRVTGQTTMNTFLSQLIVLIVSLGMTVLVGVATGELVWDGDLAVTAGAVMSVATIVYKNFQDQFDKLTV